ncbi:c2H2-type domain-containing protein [Caerostris extrusa]|uniref:C2H2-type domain-containing protein n=1 Tax=Caerostris extrusa TaxID=172846 RepID=A0AAV4WSN4_CAEEX|nr:c2H2-type domain-containing protein [Caerostris extrusa]
MPLIPRSNDSYDPHLCHICTKRFLPGEIRVRDHNHWGSGRINGLAHQACNLNYRATYFIPVVIHNSRNYDNHLLLKSIPLNIAKCIGIIPVNMEKFTMFSLDHLKFLDSYQFLDIPSKDK